MIQKYIFLLLVNFIKCSSQESVILQRKSDLKVYDDNESSAKSSLVFVFDTTGSMYNDLRQLRDGAEMILKTALEDSDVIEDFVFVPFHDPAVGPPTVTKDKDVFKSVLSMVRVYGGGDCPEKSLGGIMMALNVSRSRSFIYVFTDATASDHRMVGKVLDSVQRKQSQIVFVLTGHCNDLHRPHYKVYHQIAAASSGQVFNLNKTSVHKVLDFVRSSIRGRMVNLGTAVNPAGYNYSQAIPIDRSLGEVTVSVSGDKPTIRVVNPSGKELTGPPQLVTTLDLSEIMVVKVLQPEPGNWTITTGSAEDFSVKVVGMSNLTFNHGFSVETPSGLAETSYRPLQGTYNHMMIALTQTDRPVEVNFAEILSLNGKTLFEVPLKMIDSSKKIYLADAFMPPDDFFYIAINGRDEYKQELRRIGATAVQAKAPDAPYLTAPKTIEARTHDTVKLKCNIESLVPLTAMWTKDNIKMQPQISSLQSTILEYFIEDMSEQEAGTYICVAKNVAGITTTSTEVIYLVDPPQVSVLPVNMTIEDGFNITISCIVRSDVLLLKYQLIFNGTFGQNVLDIVMEPNIEGVYVFNKTLYNFDEKNSGIYTCVAANRGGVVSRSTNLTIVIYPQAQLLGPHTLTKLKHTDIQLVCHVEHADRIVWLAPNDSVISVISVNGEYTHMFDIHDVSEDGVWQCVAFKGRRNASDSIQITVLIKPEVQIEGPKNITILNGTVVEITCKIEAKPEPRIIWHKETERFLNNSISVLESNIYKSVLTLDSTKEQVNGTYFCFGENSEGIHQDSITINVRRKMTLLEGFKDTFIQLYSQISLQCNVDCYPPANLKWYHNGTLLNATDNLYLSDNNNTLYIMKLDFDNLGSYMCKADNGYEVLDVVGNLFVVGLELPIISKTPNEVKTLKGNSAIIPCRVTGNPEPKILWQYKTVDSELFTTLPDHTILSSDGEEVIILNADVLHSGIYKCKAQNILGSDEHVVSLVVQYPPQIIKETGDTDKPIQVKAGTKVTFSCENIGYPPPVVTWRKDDRTIGYSDKIYLTDTSELILNNVTEYDSGLYSCNATSSVGSAQKNFTLTVYVPPILNPVETTELRALEGDLIELPCSAVGVPTPTVMWLQNGEVITETRKHIDSFGLRFVANLTDFGDYTCIASNQYANASRVFSVYVWVPPYIEPPWKITTNILIGDDVTFKCDVIGFPLPKVFWEYQSEPLKNNSEGVSFDDYGNLNIKTVTHHHEGVYTCVAENVAGLSKKYFYLNVNEPPQILNDKYTGPYVATDKDSELVISCRATGKPAPFVIWTKDGFYIDTDHRFTIDSDGTLTIKNPTPNLSGNYMCIAKNSLGFANKSFAVEIYPIFPPRMQADEFRASVIVVEGANASIECPVRLPNTDSVKWYKDAKLLSEGLLNITNVTRHNASSYACVVTNAVTSIHSTIEVIVEWPPKFVTIINNSVQQIKIVKGNDVYFDCETDSNPESRTKWFFNRKPLLGEEVERLKIMNVQMRHRGFYKCIVGNKHGAIEKEFSLDVLEPPFISKFDLLDVQLKVGMNATLECDARGSPAPHVTWMRNNTRLLTQNLSLTITNVTRESQGLYRCDATNEAGATYIVYRVIVTSPAKVIEVVLYRGKGDGETVREGGVDVTLNSRVRLSCVALGEPQPNIQWIRNGALLSQNTKGIDYADLVLDKVDTSAVGVYFCIASNDGGVDELTVELDVLEPPQIFQDIFQPWNQNNNVTKLEVMSGQTFYMQCHPYGNPMPEIYWFKDGLPLRLFDDSMVSKDYGEVLVSNGAKYEQSGNYTCVARNSVGNATVGYIVDVLVPPTVPKESNVPISTRLGRELVLKCPAEGSPPPQVMWVKHPYNEIYDTNRLALIDQNYTLIINKTEVSDSGLYSCIITNKVGTTEVIFEVTIEKAPSIAGYVGSDVVESHVVPLKRSVVLKCEVDGHPTPKIRWLKDTQQLSNTSSYIHQVLSNSLLAIWSVDTIHAGQYICIAENKAGIANRRYNVVVKVPGKWSRWSQWSFCNTTCGLGYQRRDRSCHYVDDYNVTFDKSSKSDKVLLDESSCKGSSSDRRKCHMPLCEDDSSQGHWSVWSKWSSCSTSCGVGMQSRTRRCRSKLPCEGDNVQIRKCPGLPKCDLNSSNNVSDNEVYYKEDRTSIEKSAFVPEMTFEMQPEVVNTQYATDAEEVYAQPETKYSSVYYEVDVTENLDGSARGDCQPGYKQGSVSGSCVDIDECVIDNNQCHATQVCENTSGGYRCTCPKGFVALGVGQRCLDINECSQDIAGCEYACVNTAGGYVCACPTKLRLHTDRHHCVMPSSYRRPYSYEDTESDNYMTAAVDFPARYMRNRT